MRDTAQSNADVDAATTRLGEVIAEFGRHLDTLAEQLSASIMEADRQCVSVGESFHELAAARRIIDGIACAEPVRTTLAETGRQMGASIHTAVVALQYHDRLAQRLVLVRAGLDRLQSLLHTKPGRSYEEWLQSLRDVDRVNRAERLRLAPGPATDAGMASSAGSSSVELF